MSCQSNTPYWLAVFLTLLIQSVLTFSGHSCPPPTLFTSVAAKTCDVHSQYHCLYNEKSKLYEDYCFKPIKYPVGSYVLYQGGLNSPRCSSDRYQPESYYSNQYYSRCMLSKTRCSEEGQVVHDDSFTEKDTTCRCDYTQGYDFVTKPRNRCFCIPTEEDCSCYKRRCPENTTLTPDYHCLKTVGLLTCPVIKHKGDKTDIKVVVTKQEDFKSEHSTLSYRSGFQKWFVCGAIPVVMAFLLFDEEAASVTLDENVKFDDNPSTEDEAKKIITTNGFRKSVGIIEKHRLVVIKGRYGTGKSFMTDQIAQWFPNYECLLIKREDFSKFVDIEPAEKNQIIIFDEVCGRYEGIEGRSKIIHVIKKYVHVSTNLVVITAGEYNNAFIDSLRKMALAVDDNLIDLDIEFALSKEEKRSMLTYHLNLFEIEHDDGSDWDTALLSDEVTEVIVSTDTFHGFPLLCTMFCSDLNNIKLGSKYFRQPPQQLIDEIERTRVHSTNDESSKIQYSVLVYILLNTGGCIDVNNINSGLVRDVGGFIFGFKFHEKDLIQYMDKKDIFLQRVLQHHGAGKYSMHPTVYQAVLLSFSLFKFNKQVVEKCKLEHILDLFRMPDYKPLPNEIVILCKIDKVKDFCEILAKRMVSASFVDEAYIHKVCQYIIKSHNVYLSRNFFGRLEEDICTYITSKRVHTMLIVFKEFVLETELGYLKENLFLITWSVLACNICGHYTLMADLLNAPIITTTKTLTIAMLGTIVDEYDNNMLTYCTLWWTTNTEHPFVRAVSSLLSQQLGNVSIEHLFNRTETGVSPIVFAAYFGRHQCLQTFLLLQKQYAKEKLLNKATKHKFRNEIEELMQFAKKGQQRFLLDNIKYNTEICPKVELGTVSDFQKTYKIFGELLDN